MEAKKVKIPADFSLESQKSTQKPINLEFCVRETPFKTEGKIKNFLRYIKLKNVTSRHVS
jgi:hypothetical protein